MTEMFRCRVDKALLKRARKVADDMGTSTSELVRMFLKALAKSGQLPFTPQAGTEEEEMLGPVARRRQMMDYFSGH